MAAHDNIADVLLTAHDAQMRTPLLLIIFCVVLHGCSATEEKSTPWTSSPAGDWQTRIQRSDTAGPGVGYLAETVQIRQRNADQLTDIFALEEMSGVGKIEVRWRDPRHLQVAYANGDVILQVVKVGDLSIEAIPLVTR
jgi:hypothetical protein